MLQPHALADEVVHRQGGEHPVLDGVLAQNFLVSNVIAVAIAPVAVDVDAKDVLDGILVTVEGGAAQRHAFAHLRPQPSLVDFRKGDPLRAVDGVHQPDVFLE